MIKLRAIRPVACDAGRIKQGEVFETDPTTALHLEAGGYAERYYERPTAAPLAILEAIRARMIQPAPAENKRSTKKSKSEPVATAPKLTI